MNAYEVRVAPVEADGQKTLEFEFPCHEDLLELAERVKAKQLFPDEESVTFVVGLKLFSSVLLKHRNEPLFAEFAPHFGAWMKKLKAQ